MDYKLAYLVIGILIILIFFKNNKSHLEKKMNINSSEGFDNNKNNIPPPIRVLFSFDILPRLKVLFLLIYRLKYFLNISYILSNICLK